MFDGLWLELAIGAGLILLIAGVTVARRRRPPTHRGATRAKDFEAMERAERAAIDMREAAKSAAPSEVAERPPAEEPPPVEERAPAARPTLRERLAKSRRFLADRLSDALGRDLDDDSWDDLEAALIQADVGASSASEIVADLRATARERRASGSDEIRGLLAQELISRFDANRGRALGFAPDGPTVWLVVGVNGTGKTTTIGKLAADLRERGHSVALAAADTFRAAADEQLTIWAERAGAQVVKHQPGADPGAVAFDAFRYARARGVDVLIVDTAGRLHTKRPLMDELGKIRRVLEKEGDVQESLLVLDATAGQNGLSQAREFAIAAGVTGAVLTKLDGSAKGGIALAIEQDLGLPIKLIGVGEGVDDLEPFDPKTYVDALLA
jgi:fused signal recognition particle receptor